MTPMERLQRAGSTGIEASERPRSKARPYLALVAQGRAVLKHGRYYETAAWRAVQDRSKMRETR